MSDLLNVIEQRKWTIIVSGLIGALIGFLTMLPDAKIHRARSLIEFQVPANYLPMDPGFGVEAEDPVLEGHLNVIRSKPLVERTVNALLKKTAIQPNTGSFARALGLQPEEERRKWLIEATASTLKARAIAGTHIAEVYCESTDPGIAAAFNTMLTEEFVEQTFEQRRALTQLTGESLSEQVNTLRKNLEKSEWELQAYAAKENLVYTADQELSDFVRLRSLEGELQKAEAEKRAKETIYKQAMSPDRSRTPQAYANNELREDEPELKALRLELRELRESLEADHPRVRAISTRIADIEKAVEAKYNRLARIASADYQAALRAEQLLRDAVEEQKRTAAMRLAKAAGYDELKRVVDTNRSLYAGMLRRMKSVSFGLEPYSSNVRIIEPAQTAPVPGQYGRHISTLRGLLGGLVISIAISLLWYRGNRTVKSPVDMLPWLPELGTIPPLATTALGADGPIGTPARWSKLRWSRLNWLPRRRATRLANSQWAAKEAFRSVLASLLCRARATEGTRVVAVTSPGPDEGRTLVAANLACAAAQLGQRVLLIDADLRRPELHRLFNIEAGPGLSEALRNELFTAELPVEALAQPTPVPGLQILSAGVVDREDPMLLYSERLRDIIRGFQEHFDIIFIDTPPVSIFADARFVARRCDGAIIIARVGHTTCESVVAAAQLLLEDGTPVLGTVLNECKQPFGAPNWGAHCEPDDEELTVYRIAGPASAHETRATDAKRNQVG